MSTNCIVESFRDVDPELYRQMKITEAKYSPRSSAVPLDRFVGKNYSDMSCHSCGCHLFPEFTKDARFQLSEERVFLKLYQKHPTTGELVQIWRPVHPAHVQYYCKNCAKPRPDGTVVVKLARGHKLTQADRLDLAMALKGLHEDLGRSMKIATPAEVTREVDKWVADFADKLRVPVYKLPLAVFQDLNAQEVLVGKSPA